MKNSRSFVTLFGIALAVANASFSAETRFHEYTKKFSDPADGAKVISAGFFGGAGNEWLVAGGFTPDGGIVLAGNVIGPEFREAGVLGKDAPKPAAAVRQPELDGKGNPKTNKDGTAKMKVPSWLDSGVTGYLIRASADLKTIISTHRMPWESGAITSIAVGRDGTIYLAGKANDSITLLGGEIKELKGQPRTEENKACSHAFLAKLAPDASKVLWVRHYKGSSNAPKVTLLADASIQFSAHHLWNLSSDGAEIGRLEVKESLGNLAAVNPKDGSFVRVGEHHSPTGREPWRCPVFNVFNADGTQRHQLYDWLGPYVGLDNLRLVSDTAVRRVTFDAQGNILLYLWSDGGNSVALREPYDIKTTAPGFNGLGFGSWGAGVLSAAYIIRIDPKTYQVKSGTMWMAYLETTNKPNSAWIDQLGFSPDGSICFTGRAANCVIQTSNRLSPNNSGQHVVILSEDMKSIRFSSTVPGSGMARTGDADETWGIAADTVGKKQRVLFLTGASEGEGEFKTPVVNASQTTFGGGWMDGYAVLLEMDHNALPATPETTAAPTTDWQTKNNAPKAPVFTDGKGRGPQAGQSFHFQALKWVTVDAEFRDPTRKLWPSFLYGRPKSGSFKFDPVRPQMQGTWLCDRICQPNDNPGGKVVGEWAVGKGDAIDFSFEIKSLGAFQTRQESRMEGTKERTREVLFVPALASMNIQGRSYPIKAECHFSWQYPRDAKQPGGVQVDAFFTTTGKALGLKNPKAAGEIKVRVSAVGTSESTNTQKQATPKSS